MFEHCQTGGCFPGDGGSWELDGLSRLEKKELAQLGQALGITRYFKDREKYVRRLRDTKGVLEELRTYCSVDQLAKDKTKKELCAYLTVAQKMGVSRTKKEIAHILLGWKTVCEENRRLYCSGCSRFVEENFVSTVRFPYSGFGAFCGK